MRNRPIFTLLCILFSYTAIASSNTSDIPRKVAERRDELLSQNDSVIIYENNCSGCVQGARASTILLYKFHGKYWLEQYTWEIQTDGKVKHIRTAKKSKYIGQIFHFVAQNIKDLQRYDGNKDLSGNTIAKSKNDTATNGRTYLSKIDHGRSIEYTIKLGDRTIRTGSAYTTDVYYHIKQFPSVGTLLLLLNIISMKDDVFMSLK